MGTGRRRRAVWTAVLALSACTAGAAPADLPARFQAELDALHQQYKFPGATAAYVLPDGTVVRAATGLADVEAGTPMRPESRMLAASIGKSLFGAEALALAGEGKLDLDAPISRWLTDRPWFRRLPNHAGITLRQLLQHTSGIPDHVYLKSFDALVAARWKDVARPIGVQEQVDLVLDAPPLFKPGKGWTYTDTGYLVAGLILEQAAGRDLYEEITRRFIAPLGLTLTSPSNVVNLPGLAAGYMAKDNRMGLPPKTTAAPGVMVWNPAMEWAGGGFASNAGDLALWAKALFEGKAMPGEYRKDLFRGAPVAPGHPEVKVTYGIGVGLKETGPNGANFGHGGWIPGYVSSLRYYPAERVAVAFQINTDVGMQDDATSPYDDIEKRLAAVVLDAVRAASLTGFAPARATSQRALEAQFDAGLSAESIGERQRDMASAPNHVGSPHNRANAERVADDFRRWGWQADIETFTVLSPVPRRQVLELGGPAPHRARFDEPPIAEDPTTSKTDGVLPGYLAYAVDGRVKAPLVYVNRGLEADYAELDRLGVSVAGKIVIARFGGGWRGNKPKLAAAHGAVGCILYSDPADDGFGRGDVWPKGAWRPAAGIQRGSVMDLPVAPGDPETPGYGSTEKAPRVAFRDLTSLAPIPSVAIGYGDAQPFLAALSGAEAPAAWRGGLPITYRVGPSAAPVRLVVKSDWRHETLYNVIARIPGSDFADTWVVRGNNRDAWVYGAWVALSGHSAMMEEARAIGGLLASGWKPRRTIVYASWDGEEGGLIGSTEWAETHAEALQQHAALYVNTGINGRGFVDVTASYSTQALVDEVTADVRDPRTGEAVRARWLAANGRDAMPVADLGAGSDYTPFAQHLGIASIDVSFSGEDEQFGIYHSAYDTMAHFERFGDPGFVYGRALAQVAGRLVLRAADADRLPLQPAAVSARVTAQVKEIADLARGADGAALDLAPLEQAASQLAASATRLTRVESERAADAAAPPSFERALAAFEQCWISPAGLPGRPWYRHLGYAPGLAAGYAAKTLPGVREAIEGRRWDEARNYVARTAAAMNACAAQVDAATAALAGEAVS